jgi:hypothetical protein
MGDSAPKASVASPSRYREVGARKGHRCLLLDSVHGVASGARERDKRGRGSGRGPGSQRADASGRRA